MMKTIKQAAALILTLCLCLTIMAGATAETESLAGKTVIVYTGNVRGDVTVYPKVAALRKAYEAAGATVILADAGNYLQGTVYASYDSGRSIVELMTAAGYKVAAVGSHEFDFGTGMVGVEQHEVYYADESFGKLTENAGFIVTAANISAATEDGGTVAAYASTVRPLPETEITFIGLTDPETVNRVQESSLAGLTFTAPNVDASVEGLTVALSNAGTLAADVVIDIPEGAGLTVGRVVIDTAALKVEKQETLDLTQLEDDAELLSAVNQLKETVDASVGAAVRSEVTLDGATAHVRGMETNTGDLWTDALLWFATEGGMEAYYDQDEVDNGNTGLAVDAAHTVALWNGGNLRGYVNTGDVTMKDLQRVLPYPNKVAVVYLTGAQLLTQLEAATAALPYSAESDAACASFPQVAGMTYTVDTSLPFDAGEAYGESWFKVNAVNRTTIESIGGAAFDPEAVYAVITSNAIFNGMDAYYVSAEKDAEKSTITSAAVVDVVMLYIQQKLGGVIGEEYAAPMGRISIK